jgi:GH24 family phage-related lysozyme (muramidase)
MPTIPFQPRAEDDGDAQTDAPDSAMPANEAEHVDAQAAAKNADVAITDTANSLLYDGDQPFMALGGEAAVRAAPQALDAIGQAYDQATAGLSPYARRISDPVFAERMNGWRGDIQRHALAQRDVALDQASQARQTMALGEVDRYALADPARAEANLHSVLSEVHVRAERQGLSPDEIAAARRQAAGDAWSGAVGSRLAADPHAALALLDARQDQIDPATLAALRPQVEDEAARVGGERQVDALVSAARPAIAPAAAAVLPADAHPPLDVAAIAARAMDQAGPEPERQASAGLYAQAQAMKLNAQRTQAIRAATAKAQPYLSDPAVASLSQIPADVRLALPGSTRDALVAHFAAGGHPPSTDEVAHADLYDLLARAPDRFLDLDLTGASTRFERHDYHKLLADQATLREGGPAAQALKRATGQAIGAADAMLADIGVTPDAAPDQVAASRSSMLRAVDAAQAANDGRPLDAPAIAKLADDTAMAATWTGAPAMKPRHGMMERARYFLPTEDGADEGGGGSEGESEDAAPAAADNAEPAAARVPAVAQAAAQGGLEKPAHFNPPPEGALDPILRAIGIPTAQDEYFARKGAKMRDVKMTPQEREAFGRLQRDAAKDARDMQQAAASKALPHINQLDTSPAGVDFLKGYEKYRDHLYNSDGAGRWTIGRGHLVRGEEFKLYKNGISEEDANNLFQNDLRKTVVTLRQNLKVPVTQPQFDALISLGYNSPSAITSRKSTLMRLINSGNLSAAADEFPKWSLAHDPNHVPIHPPGLAIRRAAERRMFADGVYDSRH